MNLREELLLEHSKAQAVKITRWIGSDITRFAKLIDLVSSGERRLSQRASWVMKHSTDIYPELAAPHLDTLIHYAEKGKHVAVKRNIIRMLHRVDIPEDLQGAAYDLCWNNARSTKQEIAVRVFSLQVLERLAVSHPALRGEVLSAAEDFLLADSPALRSRGRRTKARLGKLG